MKSNRRLSSSTLSLFLLFFISRHLQFTLESDIAQEDSFDGNSISRGGTEVLLGDLNLKADNR